MRLLQCTGPAVTFQMAVTFEMAVLCSSAADASDPPSLPLPAPPVTASCHCGQTRLEAAEAGPLEVYACHCGPCQQITGSSFAWNAFFAPDQVQRIAS